MKKTLFFVAVIAIALVSMSNQRGRGLAFGPATGAPGESGSTCGQSSCHSSGAFNPSLKVYLSQDGEHVESYLPGETYSVSLKINHTGLPNGYGFQMVCLEDDTDNNPINNFIDLPNGIGEIFLLDDRQYVEQNGRLPVDSIWMTWVAPERETGDITFYVAANAINNNSSPSGDGAASGSFTFKEAIGLSTKDQEPQEIITYPNPTTNTINISDNITVQNLVIFNLSGHKLLSQQSDKLDISHLDSGIYILKITDTSGRVTIQLISKI